MPPANDNTEILEVLGVSVGFWLPCVILIGAWAFTLRSIRGTDANGA